MDRKKILILVVILFFIFGLILYYFFKKDSSHVNENRKTESEKINEEPVKVPVKETVEHALQHTFYKENKGFIVSDYKYDNENYLLITQVRGNGYSEKFPGDQLIWAKKEEKTWNYQNLASGDYLIHLEHRHNEPFIRAENDYFIVFYEIEGNIHNPRMGKGYVYKLNEKKSLEKVFETKGSFHQLVYDKNNNMIIVEKVYRMDRNLYPSYLRPYDLHYKKWDGKAWKTFKKEFVKPDIEKEYEEHDEKEKQIKKERKEEQEKK